MSKQDIRQMELNQAVFWKDKAILFSLALLVVFLLLAWIMWIMLYRQSSVVMGIPVYFNFLQFNEKLYKYVIPIFGSVVALIHLLIAFFAYNRERLVSYFLIGGAAFLEVLVLVTVIYYMSYV
ncbi:MAG: hypothetical protein WC570_01415 [Patescibacteria group bacterium]